MQAMYRNHTERQYRRLILPLIFARMWAIYILDHTNIDRPFTKADFVDLQYRMRVRAAMYMLPEWNESHGKRTLRRLIKARDKRS